jgi:hypothetical protein
MLVFVAPYAWRVLVTHEGPWDPVRAVTFAVWATYPALALFAVFRPLRWLPLLAAVVPWGYAWRTYFGWPRRSAEAQPAGAAT